MSRFLFCTKGAPGHVNPGPIVRYGQRPGVDGFPEEQAWRTNRSAKPSKLAHVGFGTNQFDAMKRWWQVALGARVIHENEDMALLSYDDEPTRVAIVRHAEARAGERRGPADHVAFEFSCLADLLGRYEALCEQTSSPYWAVRHRGTTSLYYRDPDGNTAELYVPNFQSTERLLASFGEPRSGPGTPFEPEAALERLRRGDREESILNPSQR